MTRSSLTIGTRGSRLAVAQSELVADLLRRAHPDLVVDVRRIVTQGDRQQHKALPEIGGKGLFTAELESALFEGDIDLAVHSLKDLPTAIPDGLVLAGVPVRADARDALVAAEGRTLAGLPPEAVIGTSSLRRQAQLRRLRPDLRFTVLRGNVDTRLRKVLDEGRCDATVLAMAGLVRTDLADRVTEILDPEQVTPACGQGALALQARAGDDRVGALLAPVHHELTFRAVQCERRVLHALGGGCHAPIGVHARAEGGRLTCRAIVLSPDGQEHAAAEVEGTDDAVDAVAARVVGHLRDAGAEALLAACRRGLKGE